MHRQKMTIKRNFQKLRESPGVRYESVGRGFESLPSHFEDQNTMYAGLFLLLKNHKKSSYNVSLQLDFYVYI